MKTNTIITANTILATLLALGMGFPGTTLAKDDNWSRKADMPTPRNGLSTCVVNGRIYAIGGYREAGASGMKTVEVYDPVTDSWTRKTDMPTARLMSASAAANGKIYTIGGDQRFMSSPLKMVEEYDPTTDTWTRKTDMPTARSGLAAVTIDGKIYVIGGLTTFDASSLSTVEVYDPVMDTWERKAPMPTPRGLLHASVVDGKIYVIGSSRAPSGPWLPTVEMYDPATDAWTRKANMPTARGASAGGTVHGKIYVMGGKDCCASFATVEEYDPSSDTWIKRAGMWATKPESPSRRWNFSASEVNGRIYTIGGAFEVGSPHPGVSLVLEYTPPAAEPEPVDVAWPTPASIVYGTALTADQLNAQVADGIDGTFSYTPALGVILEAGNHTLAVTFEPADPALGQPASATVEINVAPAPLTIRAADQQRAAGLANPSLSVLYLGFVNGDTEQVLDAPVAVETAATIESPPGSYPIVLSAAADANYAVTFENGILTVEEAVDSGLPELSLLHRGGTLEFTWPAAESSLWRSVDLLEWIPVDGAVAENGVARVTLALGDSSRAIAQEFFRLQRSQ